MGKIILEEDLIIPKGTEFEDVSQTRITLSDGNYQAEIETSKDSTLYLIINDDVIKDNPDKYYIVGDIDYTDNNDEDL